MLKNLDIKLEKEYDEGYQRGIEGSKLEWDWRTDVQLNTWSGWKKAMAIAVSQPHVGFFLFFG